MRLDKWEDKANDNYIIWELRLSVCKDQWAVGLVIWS